MTQTTSQTGAGARPDGGQRCPTPRCVALVGPQSSGKTTLLEALLHATGATGRRGSVADGTSVGDAGEDARARKMSTEISVAGFTYLGDAWTVLDCPGSIELLHEAQAALMVADIAVVVAEPEPDRVVALGPLLRFLDEIGLPHLIFLNKMDAAAARVRDLMEQLQTVSGRPLVLRQVPIRDGDGETVTGYVDLASERAYAYRAGQPSDLIRMPETVIDREQEARQELLEALADFDDTLLEQLLEDVLPARDEIYDQIRRDLSQDLIVPVLLGAAEKDHGVRRLLKALRHDGPSHETTLKRRELPAGEPLVQVFKTVHAAHTGKLSYARIWRGALADGMALGELKLGGLYQIQGGATTKVARAEAGSIVGLARLDEPTTGDLLSPSGIRKAPDWPAVPSPVFAVAIGTDNRNDEVKLSGALQKLLEEDAALQSVHDEDTGQLVLKGQGDIHLQIALDRLRRRANVSVTSRPPQVPYKETIRKGTTKHARHKKQTGGHGQFADIHVDIAPLGRGEGFAFTDSIVGGVVPKQYIPAVEAGVKDALARGPLGFPVVDLTVKLTGGQYHSVDSSEMAFRTAGRMALADSLAECQPVLLEPIWEVALQVPNAYTARAQRVLSGRRGQILGFDARPGWEGWDEVRAYIPQAEMQDMIIELRSLSQGVGTYEGKFSHLAELTGKLADKVVEERTQMAAQ